MNKIEKSSKVLIWFGVALALLTVLCLIGGIALFIGDFHWLKLTFGILLLLLAIFFALLAVYFIWVGASQKATKDGTVAQDNFAQRGVVNAKLCLKCGNRLPEGADFCPKCGQTASSCKVCECGAENNIENKRCTSCGKILD